MDLVRLPNRDSTVLWEIHFPLLSSYCPGGNSVIFALSNTANYELLENSVDGIDCKSCLHFLLQVERQANHLLCVTCKKQARRNLTLVLQRSLLRGDHAREYHFSRSRFQRVERLDYSFAVSSC